MTLTPVIVFLMMVSVSWALLFERSSPIASADDRAIAESCLALADQGSCEFYSCFESRLPCGREWYMLRTGHYYCNKMQRQKPNFSLAGQRFIEDAQRCLTQSLKDEYRLDDIDCHTLEHQAVDSITPCFINNDFCNAFRTDAAQFFRVYEFSDLFTRGAGKIWRQIVNMAAQCGGAAAREITSDTSETVINTVNTFFDSLSRGVGK
ncbi:unnamed protein product [Lymnaea stagnalis]|uniref:Stanniocalcin n=1 Tax=Lymnaea stagnalis TaxID=6523 RepID=A0AAV2ICG1_LYMST